MDSDARVKKGLLELVMSMNLEGLSTEISLELEHFVIIMYSN